MKAVKYVIASLLLSLAATPLFAQTADDWIGWYQTFCAANPAMVSTWATILGMLGSAGAFGFVASHFPAFRKLFGAKTVAAGAILLTLGACTAAQLQQAQADISTGIAAACLDVQAAAALPGANPNLKPWATGSCGTAAAVAGLVQSSATLQWLGQLQGQLTATAKPSA